MAKHSLSLSHMLSSNFIGSLAEGLSDLHELPICLYEGGLGGALRGYELSICLSEGIQEGDLGRGWGSKRGVCLIYLVISGSELGGVQEGSPGGVCLEGVWEGVFEGD